MSEQNNSFHYTYSSAQQKEVEAIRKKYVSDTAEISESKLEKLRKLDAGVTNKASTISLCVGITCLLIMGLGMSLIMSEFGDGLGTALEWTLGLLCGGIGMAGIIAAYPLYQWVLKRERKKAAPQILKLTEELSQE